MFACLFSRARLLISQSKLSLCMNNLKISSVSCILFMGSMTATKSKQVKLRHDRYGDMKTIHKISYNEFLP